MNGAIFTVRQVGGNVIAGWIGQGLSFREASIFEFRVGELLVALEMVISKAVGVMRFGPAVEAEGMRKLKEGLRKLKEGLPSVTVEVVRGYVFGPSPPSGWVEDLHLQAVEHARQNDKKPTDRNPWAFLQLFQ